MSTEAEPERSEDEHTLDLELMRMTVDDLRQEMRRLRGQMERIVIARTDEGHDRARWPTRTHRGDAGFDLYVSRTTALLPGQFTDVPCHIRIQLPPNMWGLVIGRSSTLRTRGIMINLGVIDQGYRGEMFCGAWNLNPDTVTVMQGDRVAQLIPMPLLAATVALDEGELDRGDRGYQGFGSTGR